MQVLLITAFIALAILAGLSFLAMVHAGKTLRLNLANFSLSYILGTGIISLLTLIAEMAGLPLGKPLIWGVPLIFILTGFIWKRHTLAECFKTLRLSLGVADIPPLLVIILFGIVPVWRSYYFPPYSYDSMLGIDLIAKYAVRDGSISGSELFKTLLPLSKAYDNQLFYAPYAMLMQVVTRGIGIDFGQAWLGLLSFFFNLYFYAIARKHAHAAVAFFALLFILFVPEFFAYTFILQTDYSNAVFFFIGAYYFYAYHQEGKDTSLALACAGMFFACWSRTETIFFIPFGSLWLLVAAYRRVKAVKLEIIRAPFLFSFIPALAVFLWSVLYKSLYLPDTKSLGDQIQTKSGNLAAMVGQHFREMNEVVIFKMEYWNYAVLLFIIACVIGLSLSAYKKAPPRGAVFLFWILVIYAGFHLLLLIFPAVNIPFTFRRGFFKLIPLMGFYFVLGDIGRWISGKTTEEA